MHIALLLLPGVDVTSFWTLVAATWIAAAIGTFLTWLATAGTDDAFTATLRGFGRRHPQVPDPEIDGVVFVQLDGVPFPVAQWALQSGTMPTLRRWVDSGTHRLQEWTVQLPCTTPASQQGILHGTLAGIPAFRWYDRELGRVLVANKPADALIIEERASTGLGLLADDGVSISNLFSGDAATSMLTMSQVKLGRGSRETREAVARFVLRPDGLARSFARTTAEAVRERFQARQQRRRAVVPRMHRSWTFAFLRAVSNGVLRDLNMALVSRQMLRGARSIYVDFVDYDEVAHHAGGNRLESLKVLESLDQVLNVLEQVSRRRATPVSLRRRLRPRAVVGSTLRGPLREVAGGRVRRAHPRGRGLAGGERRELGPGGIRRGRPGRRLDRWTDRCAGILTPARTAQRPTGTLRAVTSSSSVRETSAWSTSPGRSVCVREQIDERWPRLLPGLAATPGSRVHRRAEPHARTCRDRR